MQKAVGATRAPTTWFQEHSLACAKRLVSNWFIKGLSIWLYLSDGTRKRYRAAKNRLCVPVAGSCLSQNDLCEWK